MRLLFGGIVWLSAGSALACSEIIGVFGEPMPASGATWPANAAIFVPGGGLHLEGLAVTVDGAPARLVAAPRLHQTMWNGSYERDVEWEAAFVRPAPAPGARVRIEGDPCEAWADCPETFSMDYVAGPPDEAAPPAPLDVWFDLRVHHERSGSPGDCDPVWGDATWTVHFRGGEDAGAPAFARLEARVAGGEWRARESRPLLPGPSALTAMGDIARGFEGEALAEATCYRVVAVDLAGHEAASGEVCRPCHFIEGPVEPEEGEAPEWRAWGPENEYPEGICEANAPPPADMGVPAPDMGAPPADMGEAAPDAAGADSEAPANGGGGCSAAGSGAAGLWGLLLLARRRHRRDTPRDSGI